MWKLERQRAQVHAEEQQHLSDSTPFNTLAITFFSNSKKKNPGNLGKNLFYIQTIAA